jgi:ADP-ribose pyrophosphatase YjhB (NUDIX family)
MVDDKKKSFAGTAANEIKEETGLEITESELIKMSQIAFNESKKRNTTAPHAWQTFGATRVAANEKLADAFYMSCGGTDESMEAFYVLKRLPRDKFNKLNGTEHGNKEENEKITLRLVPLADVFFECQRDAKSLAALALYQNLKAKGLLK